MADLHEPFYFLILVFLTPFTNPYMGGGGEISKSEKFKHTRISADRYSTDAKGGSISYPSKVRLMYRMYIF